MIVFDLDGCLIDSGELIRQSYRDAGASPPAGFLTLGHHDWLADETAHARKNAAYLRRLAGGPLTFLPAWQVAERLRGEGRPVALLTGAPDGTIRVLESRAPSWPFMFAQAALTPAGKTAWLAGAGHGVYVDDQRYVALPGGWRFVHYAGQDALGLYGEVIA